MATWKNFEFKMWLKEINASCLSQEKLKLEAMKFSEKFDNVDKKTISKICDDFEKEHKKIWKEASYDIFEEMGGTDGKMRGRKDVPPNNYFPKDQSDLKMIKVEKNMETKCEDCNIKMSSNVEVKAHIKNEHADAIKKAFSKEVMSRVPSQSKYLDWLKKDHIVEIMTPKQNVMNKEQLKEITNHNASCFFDLVAPQKNPEFGHKLTLFAIKTSVVFLSVDVHFFAINSNKVALAARNPWLKGGFLLSLVFRFCLILPIFSLWQTLTRLGLLYFPPSFFFIRASKSIF